MNMSTLYALMIGVFAGAFAGLVGVGGGIVIVPCLVWLLHFSQQKAQGTSLSVLMFPVGILGVITYYKKGYVDVGVAALICTGFVLGSLLGAKFAVNIHELWLKRFFGVVLVLMGIKTLWSA